MPEEEMPDRVDNNPDPYLPNVGSPDIYGDRELQRDGVMYPNFANEPLHKQTELLIAAIFQLKQPIDIVLHRAGITHQQLMVIAKDTHFVNECAERMIATIIATRVAEVGNTIATGAVAGDDAKIKAFLGLIGKSTPDNAVLIDLSNHELSQKLESLKEQLGDLEEDDYIDVRNDDV